MRNSLSVWITLGALFCTVACESAQRSNEAFSSYDSAAVGIALNTKAALAETDRIHLVDSLFLGSADGDETDQFYQIRGIRTLSDGSFLVLNAGTQQLRRYSADGRWINTSGGMGAGPGEMVFPVLLAAGRADTSLVMDLSKRALHVADANGEIVDQLALPHLVSGFVGFVDSSSAIFVDVNGPRRTYNTVVSMRASLLRAKDSWKSYDTLMVLPGGQQDYLYTRGELVRSVRVPFTTMPVVRVHGGKIFVADGSSPEIRMYNGSAVLQKVIRIALDTVPVTPDVWDAAVDLMLAADAEQGRGESRLMPGEAETRRRIYAEVERPRYLPFVQDLSVDPDGAIWLRIGAPYGDPQQWLAINVNGQVVSRLTLPAGLGVRGFGRDYVIGQTVDELGVERVVKYGLARQ